jgi:hypothetical protein
VTRIRGREATLAVRVIATINEGGVPEIGSTKPTPTDRRAAILQ